MARFLFSLLVLFTIHYSLFTIPVSAQTPSNCASFTVSPTSGQNFSISASGCEGFHFIIRLVYNDATTGRIIINQTSGWGEVGGLGSIPIEGTSSPNYFFSTTIPTAILTTFAATHPYPYPLTVELDDWGTTPPVIRSVNITVLDLPPPPSLTPAPAPPTPTLAMFCTSSPNRPGIKTPIGCLPFAANTSGDLPGRATISTLLAWSIRMGGGLALILFIYASFLFATARGDPQRIQSAKELFTSAILGLTAIITALVTINFLGVRVLNLGLFGFNL